MGPLIHLTCRSLLLNKKGSKGSAFKNQNYKKNISMSKMRKLAPAYLFFVNGTPALISKQLRWGYVRVI